MNRANIFILLLALFAGAAGALAQGLSLLAVESRTKPGDSNANVAPEISVDYDLKLTISIPRLFGGPVVSAGNGVRAVFTTAGEGFPRRATLARVAAAPYGVVKYNGGGGHFHVRHIVHGEREPQLRTSGLAIIEDWKRHFQRFGLAADQYPRDWGPVAIWNRYQGQPAAAVAFAVRSDGSIDPASVSNRTVELSDDPGWMTHAWPSFVQAAGLLAESPFPGGDRTRLTGPGASWTGADARGSLASLMRAAKAAVPSQQGRVAAPTIPAVSPSWSATAAGAYWQLVATIPATQLGGDAKLVAYRREVLFDPATKAIVSDSVALTFVMGQGRCEGRFGWTSTTGL